jgi:hypothetical protein
LSFRRTTPADRQSEFARRAAQVGRVYKTNLPKTIIGGQPARKDASELSFKKKVNGPGVSVRWKE